MSHVTPVNTGHPPVGRKSRSSAPGRCPPCQGWASPRRPSRCPASASRWSPRPHLWPRGPGAPQAASLKPPVGPCSLIPWVCWSLSVWSRDWARAPRGWTRASPCNPWSGLKNEMARMNFTNLRLHLFAIWHKRNSPSPCAELNCCISGLNCVIWGVPCHHNKLVLKCMFMSFIPRASH